MGCVAYNISVWRTFAPASQLFCQAVIFLVTITVNTEFYCFFKYRFWLHFSHE